MRRRATGDGVAGQQAGGGGGGSAQLKWYSYNTLIFVF